MHTFQAVWIGNYVNATRVQTCQKAASKRGWYQTRTVEWGTRLRTNTCQPPFQKAPIIVHATRIFHRGQRSAKSNRALSSLIPNKRRVNSSLCLWLFLCMEKNFRKISHTVHACILREYILENIYFVEMSTYVSTICNADLDYRQGDLIREIFSQETAGDCTDSSTIDISGNYRANFNQCW